MGNRYLSLNLNSKRVYDWGEAIHQKASTAPGSVAMMGEMISEVTIRRAAYAWRSRGIEASRPAHRSAAAIRRTQ
jgi:hypothetical protein